MDKDEFPSILPIAIRVAAKTLAQNIVTVVPMGGSIPMEKINEIENRLKSENRTSKLDSIIDDKEHIEKKLEDDSEFKELKKESGFKGNLFYMDYKFGNDKTDGNERVL